MPDDTVVDKPRQSVADLRRELARYKAERDEALEQQQAIAEVLAVINASSGDLAPVFDAILEKAHSQCGSTQGCLFLFDGEAFRAVALRGVPEPLAELLRQPFPGGEIQKKLLAGERLIHVPDFAALTTPADGRITRATVEIGRVRTLLTVPLRKDSALLGYITAHREEVRPFSERQVVLLENFAAQAVIAMENARLITETREALEQQTATAEVLQVINSSPGDLTPVFEAMLDKATNLCDAAFGFLDTYDGEFFHRIALRGATPEVAEFMTRTPHPPGPDNAHGRLLRGEPVVHIADIKEDKAFLSGDPLRRALVELGGRTLLAVPLRKEGLFLGDFIIFRQEVRPFTDKQIALLQNFAAQAVIAMENARLITETREALEQQTATAEVLQVINSSPGDLAPVFEAMLEKARSLCGAAYGHLYTYDGGHFHPAAAQGDPGFGEWLIQRGVFSVVPGSPLDRIVGGERFAQVTDARDTDAYRKGGGYREMVDISGTRTQLSVGLRKDGVILGVIAVHRQEVRPFTDKQIALLQNFAAQAVIAMENARLITETREALEQQTATAEVLGVINSSPGDLAPVFDAMLEKALRLCDAVLGHILSYDGECFSTLATKGEARYTEWQRQAGRQPPSNSITLQRVIDGAPIVHIADVTVDEAYRALNQPAGATGMRTLLTVALRKEDSLLGTISVYRQEVRPFTDKQIASLENFAAQAVIAMENARLITETREALDQQTATAEVLGVINASPGDLAPVFDAMLEKAMRLCEASSGELRQFDGERFLPTAARRGSGASEIFNEPLVPDAGSALEQIVRGDLVVHIPDVVDTDAYRSGVVSRRKLVESTGARTALWVALRKDDAPVGYFCFYRQEVRPFTDKQIALVQNFAAQAVIAMENARLLGELRERTEEIAGWNKELEARVATQLAELERTGKLRRFLAPQLAELIVAQGDESILESHRREIVVVFCDLRGFTPFAERAEPEEVMALLKEYHAALGPIVASFEGTLDHYSGDGIMVFFNDPLPTPDPAKRAIEMALAMREAAQGLLRSWRRHGHDLGFGVGISQGYATLGQIGFAERMDYTAIGTVTNLAARLCGEAKDGQILISARVATAIEDSARLEEIGDLSLKGLSQAVAVFNVVD